MQATNLDEQFKAAFEVASQMTITLPPDVMLRIYAYYKQATDDPNSSFAYNNNSDLRNAFKMNAWMQISHLSQEEAKSKYIEIINEIVKNQTT